MRLYRFISALLISIIIVSNMLSNSVYAAGFKFSDNYRGFPIGTLKPTAGFSATIFRNGSQIGTELKAYTDSDKISNNPERDAINSFKIYVGDKVKIKDLSRVGSGSKLIKWDFQMYDYEAIPVVQGSIPTQEIELTKAGEYNLFLAVEDDAPTTTPKEFGGKPLYFGNWSENGIHKDPNGTVPDTTIKMAWYFTHIRINVLPVPTPTSITAKFECKDEVYENQSIGYTDKTTVTPQGNYVEYRKITIEGVGNSYNDTIEHQANPSIKLPAGIYKITLLAKEGWQEDAMGVRLPKKESTYSKTITVKPQANLTEQEKEDSQPEATAIAPERAKIGETYKVKAEFFPSVGQRIKEINGVKQIFWFIDDAAHPEFNGMMEIDQKYNAQGTHSYYVKGIDTKDKIAWSNKPQTAIEDNTPTGAKAAIDIPDEIYEGVPFSVNTNGSYLAYGSEKLWLDTGVERGIGNYSYDSPYSYSKDLIGSGGTVTVDDITGVDKFELSLEVWDKNGNRDAATDYAKILPTPMTKYKFNGSKRVNRKITIDTSGSIHHQLYSFDESKTKIEIKDPETGEIAAITQAGYTNSTTIKCLPLDGEKAYFLSKKTGSFEITISKTDARGKTSVATGKVYITEDKPPKADLLVPEKIYRDSSGVAHIKIKKQGKSFDGDTLLENNLRYKIDTNNDGDFTDETEHLLNSALDQTDVTLDRSTVGKIQFLYDIKEDLTPETIPRYVTDADYLKASITKVVEVDNLAPHTSLRVINNQKIDLLMIGSEGEQGTLQTKINSIKSNLNNVGYPVLFKDQVDGIEISSDPIKLEQMLSVSKDVSEDKILGQNGDFYFYYDSTGIYKRSFKDNSTVKINIV